MRYLSLVVVVLILFSCDKYQASRWSGKYKGIKHCSSWMMNSGSTDTSYVFEVEVVSKRKYVQIAGFEIPVDSMRKENLYRIGNYDAYTEFKFVGDSLYMSNYSGGLGGGGGCSFAGVRK